jgi:hypothetical protein
MREGGPTRDAAPRAGSGLILTMDRRPTAVLTHVFPGRMTP